MKKKSNGEGTIRQRSDGRWEGRYYAPDGKRHSIYGDRKGDVRKQITEIVSEMDDDIYIDETNMTVASWMNEWLDDFSNVKYSTKKRYELDIRRYINPTLGKIPLKELSTMHIQRMYNRCKTKGLSPKSIRNIHGVLHSALKSAVKLKLIRENVSDDCELPKKRMVEMHPLNDEMLLKFLDVAKDDKYFKMYYFDIFTGLRESELIGLTWDCIDFDKGTIRIYRQYVKTQRDENGVQQFAFSSLKNDHERTIEPAVQIMDLLREVKREQNTWRLKRGSEWKNKEGFVFTKDNGMPIHFSNLYKRLKKLAIKIGCPELRVHDLRHTFATLSLQNGSDVKTISQSLGHATVAFTLDRYGHVSNTMRHDNAVKMERFISSI